MVRSLLSFFKRSKVDIAICLFFLVFAPIFFYNLGGFSLEDYDEAWYAEIARNILVNREPLILEFNGITYFDHPHLGFILMAFSMLTFGINEFGARFASALLGFLSVVFIYFLGKNLFNRVVGLTSSLILVSSVWFIFRARSGNLDAILLFFFILSFYLATKIKKNSNYIFALVLSFAALLLTKTIIGATLLLPLIVYLLINKVHVPKVKILLAAVLFLAAILPWHLANYFFEGEGSLTYQYSKALRTDTTHKINYLDLLNSNTFTYLHYGIRKWYYPALIAFVMSIPLLFKNKNVLPVLLWVVVLLFGFLKNAKTEIWHLIPLYAPMALLISYVAYESVNLGVTIVGLKHKINKKQHPIIVSIVVLVPFLFLTYIQITNYKQEIRLNDRQKSGLSVTAKVAHNRPEVLFLDSTLPIPAVAAFYSQKKVNVIINQPKFNTLKSQIEFHPRPFLLIVEKWKLDADSIPESSYKVLTKHDSHVLILVDEPYTSSSN